MPPQTDKIPVPERQVELLELIGTTLGPYKLERLLGSGGMGGVYAATAPDGKTKVAIKVLSVADPSARARIAGRFAREARASVGLKSPHIVTVLDAGSDDRGGQGPRPYLVMELLEGEDLGQRLARDGRVPLQDSLHIAAQVLVALGVAHEAGIVHRDLKPDNVFLMQQGGDATFCKLLDFGMTKFLSHRENQTLALALTKKGVAVGTPYYMAPEQARAAEDVDGRADVWALGAILFECLTGRPPFVAPSQEQILIAICTTDAPDVRALRPEVPSKVAKLIARALTRERAQRFSSAWEMLTALVEVAPSEGRMVPASAFTAMNVSVPAAPAIMAAAPSIPDATGPHASQSRVPTTIPAPPLPQAHAMPVAPIGRSAERPIARAAPARQVTSRGLLVVLALGALFLGVGVSIYILALLRSP